MRSLRLALLPLLVATTLAAQSPRDSSTTRPPVAVVAPRRGAFFDVAAWIGSRERFGLEPVAMGRWTVGLIGSHYGTGSPTLPPTVAGSGSGYNAWSLDLAVRYYPAGLSFNGPTRPVQVYVGEFVGYQRRTLTLAYYPPVILCTAPGCTDPAIEKRDLTGWEPEAEVGVRLEPAGPLFVDVGGWFKLVRVDDPTQQIRPGNLDSRLVAAVGVGW